MSFLRSRRPAGRRVRREPNGTNHQKFPDPEAAGHVVLAVLTRHVEPGEVDHVREALPEAIRTLWAVKKAA